MKNILVLYSEDDWHLENPFFPDTYKTGVSLEYWFENAKKYDVKFYRSSITWYDKNEGHFTKGWTYQNKNWIKIQDPIKPSLIYDKTLNVEFKQNVALLQEMAKDTSMINSPEVKVSLVSKISQYNQFSQFMAKTLTVQNEGELRNACEKIPGELLVVKPLLGSGGKGIVIDNKNKILEMHSSFTYPILVQEFIQSTKGIPGFSNEKGVSDLRLVFVDATLSHSLSRIAQKESLFTNFSKGARAVIVPESKIPESAMKISRRILEETSNFSPLIIALDFIFDDNGRPILLEINTMPGMGILYELGSKELLENHLDLFMKSTQKAMRVPKGGM